MTKWQAEDPSASNLVRYALDTWGPPRRGAILSYVHELDITNRQPGSFYPAEEPRVRLNTSADLRPLDVIENVSGALTLRGSEIRFVSVVSDTMAARLTRHAWQAFGKVAPQREIKEALHTLASLAVPGND